MKDAGRILIFILFFSLILIQCTKESKKIDCIDSDFSPTQCEYIHEYLK
jgi:hypothetical protein